MDCAYGHDVLFSIINTVPPCTVPSLRWMRQQQVAEPDCKRFSSETAKAAVASVAVSIYLLKAAHFSSTVHLVDSTRMLLVKRHQRLLFENLSDVHGRYTVGKGVVKVTVGAISRIASL